MGNPGQATFQGSLRKAFLPQNGFASYFYSSLFKDVLIRFLISHFAFYLPNTNSTYFCQFWLNQEILSVAFLCDLLFFQRYFLFLFGSDFDPSAAPYSLACLRMSAPSQFLAQEKFWANKAECEDAEYRYYAKLHGKVN